MKRLFALCFALLLSTAAHARGYAIQHLEPGNWWVGMRHDRVELLVHGPGIAALAPRVAWDGVTVADVARVENPNYLFVTLAIAPTAKPGRLHIDFMDGERIAVRHPWRLDTREAGSAQRRGFDARDAIYLVTPDRFANADTGNDSAAGMFEHADRADPNGRHGGDIAGMRRHLDYIAGLGFTQLWPMPLLENNQPAYSYHGYAITDLYRTDPRLGSNEDVRALSREARRRGIGLVMDVVLNHIGSQHWWLRDPPTRDWINRADAFVETNHRRTTVQDPHAAPADRALFTDGWFVRSMPDLNQRNPHLARYLIQNTLWWIEYAGLSGIREDTFGYADADFLSAWAQAVLEEYPDFAMVGEEWSANPAIVAHWQHGKANPDGHVPHMPGMLDFPLQIALRSALVQPEGWDSGFIGLYETLANDFVYPDPGRLVVFAENHDSSRVLAQLDGDLALWKLAIAYIATTRGTPQFYYGSEVLLRGPKERNDGLLRADMPGGWRGDAADAFSGRGLTPQQRNAQAFVRALFNWRKRTPVLHDGALQHYAPVDGVYVYFRYDATAGKRGKTVMIALNKNAQPTALALGRFGDFIGTDSRARDALDGQPVVLGTSLLLPAKSATLLEIAPADGAQGE
ncbi:glycoside hydrolase family 13 protein [Lysobacter solisilvae (ex Woo and Kim 2020)]|uniref:Glycoside hydrolase family 13 protein n=1 Tax=Agrilutibacter terrestris TaxID=2865112 RepID=A0A7H0G0G9_9GAMM|nr:glycoside hydrolase family 13 protein [Lysobacter terrestris]QNP41785.1 glycoside hydrolase family 13 protein [Lysobacter terrestris]